jgi:integrase
MVGPDMAIYDRWWKTQKQPDGSKKRIHSADHGCAKRWQVRWRDEQGRQRTETFDSKAAAEKADAKIRTQLTDGTYVDPSAGLVTFREYAEDWRKSRVHDLATATRIESAFRNHAYADPETPGKAPTGAPAIGDYPLRTLAKRTSVMQAWISGIKVGPNTARKIIADVSQVFTAALDEGIVARNPLSARSVQKPKCVKTDAIPWTATEVEAVADNLPARLSALPYLGAACGMRQGELFAAALIDLDFLRKTMHVEVQIKLLAGRLFFAPVKNGKTRDIPVADPVIPVLAEHIRQYPPTRITLPWGTPDGKPVTRDLLFTGSKGMALDRNDFNRMWRPAWREAGIPDRGRQNGCHVLRHTAASAWLSAGLSLAKVAAYLGDTKEVVLATYAHFMPDDDDRAREIMNAFFKPSSPGSAADSCATDVQGRVQ